MLTADRFEPEVIDDSGAAAPQEEPDQPDPGPMEHWQSRAGTGIGHRPEWHLVERIAASRSFSKSVLLRRFLLYVCREQLEGRSQQINETRVGIEVFQRADDYNPAEDNVVRNYARTLRRRLEQYFQNEGSGETLRLTIPRGGYVPVFEDLQNPGSWSPTEEPERAGESDERHLPNSAASSWHRWITRLIPTGGAFGAGVLMCLLVLGLAAHRNRGSQAVPSISSPLHALWAQMFQQSRDTLLVPTDSGLGILENLTHRPITLADYVSRASPQDGHDGLDPGSLLDLQTQHYTSAASLNIIVALSHVPEYDAGHTFIRYPRVVSTSDLKHSNVVLLGSVHANPWVSLFESSLNFRLDYLAEVNNSFVANQHPAAGELAFYRNESGPSRHVTYGVIDFLPNLDNSGHVLILQGLNMAGTEAAADVLLHSPRLQSTLQRAALPHGGLRPFEVLVRTESVGADAPQPEIVALRIHAN